MIDGIGARTRLIYVGNNLFQQIDPLDNTTTYEYFADGKVKAQIDPEGGRAAYTYNGHGDVETVIDPVGNLTRFLYDRNNFNKQTIDPLGNSTFYDADSEGNLVEMIDRDGRRRTFDYDQSGRLTKETWWDGPTVVNELTYLYDAVGNMLAANDWDSRLSFQYDALNRQVEQDNVGTPQVTHVTVHSQYDAAGDVTLTKDNLGNSHTSTHNYRGQLTRSQWTVIGQPDVTAEYSYYRNGKPREIVREASDRPATPAVTSRYGLDDANAISTVLHESEGLPLVSITLDRNAMGLITDSMINDSTATFSYDALGQVKSVTRNGLLSESFTYDANGNRRSFLSRNTITTYTVSQSNRYSHYAGTEEVVTLTYSNSGSIERLDSNLGVHTQYTFDYRERLSKVTRYEEAVVVDSTAMRYDALNRPISATHAGDITESIYVRNHRLVDITGNQWSLYLNGQELDEVLGTLHSSGSITYNLLDPQFSTVGVLQGDNLTLFDVSVFGTGAASPLPFFQGRPALLDGVFDFRTRAYSTDLGRFLSEDTVGFGGQDFNLYRFLRNSPPNHTDQFGTIAAANYAIIAADVSTIAYSAFVAEVPCPYHISGTRGAFWYPDLYFYLISTGLHEGATDVIRHFSGQQCAYDAEGRLIVYSDAAGTPDTATPFMPLGMAVHWYFDVRAK